MCEVGKRIRDRRIELGYNAEELAPMVGLSPATIYRYENGYIKKVSTPKIALFAKALKTSPAYLMGWTDDPTVNPIESEVEESFENSVSESAMKVAEAYDSMSEYGKAIIDCIIAQEEKQRRETFGKTKPLCAGTMDVPSITSVTGVPVGHPASAQAWYNSMQEQKELAEENKTKQNKT